MEDIRCAFSRNFDLPPVPLITKSHKPAGTNLSRSFVHIPNIGCGSISIGDTNRPWRYALSHSMRTNLSNLIWRSNARNIRTAQRSWENKFGNMRNGGEPTSRMPATYSFLANCGYAVE